MNHIDSVVPFCLCHIPLVVCKCLILCQIIMIFGKRSFILPITENGSWSASRTPKCLQKCWSKKQRVMIGSIASNAVIYMLMTVPVIEGQKFSRTLNWRHWSKRMHAKRWKSLLLQLESTKRPFTSNCTLACIWMIQEQGTWVPYDLNPRAAEHRLFDCEELLQREKRNGFPHGIVMGNGNIFTLATRIERSMRTARSCFYVVSWAKYLRCEGIAVYLMGRGRCYSLWAVEPHRKHYWGTAYN